MRMYKIHFKTLYITYLIYWLEVYSYLPLSEQSELKQKIDKLNNI